VRRVEPGFDAPGGAIDSGGARRGDDGGAAIDCGAFVCVGVRGASRVRPSSLGSRAAWRC